MGALPGSFSGPPVCQPYDGRLLLSTHPICAISHTRLGKVHQSSSSTAMPKIQGKDFATKVEIVRLSKVAERPLIPKVSLEMQKPSPLTPCFMLSLVHTIKSTKPDWTVHYNVLTAGHKLHAQSFPMATEPAPLPEELLHLY